MYVLPLKDIPDDNHDDHRYEYDKAGEKHEGTREGLDAGVVDDSIERVGEEVDKARDEGEAGEYPAHLSTVH